MSYLCSYYHFVFRTKRNEYTITSEHSQRLYNFILSIATRLNCRLIRINGMPDHIHMAVEMPDTLPSVLMREVKSRSSRWMKENPDLFPNFDGWGKEYFGSSFSYRDLDKVVNYIANQRTHHQTQSLSEEMKAFFSGTGQEEKAKYFLSDDCA